MCGISAIIKNSEVDKKINYFKVIKNMNHSIKHRGPDDEGFVIFDNQTNDKKIFCDFESANKQKSKLEYLPIKDNNYEISECKLALGHRRLSIQDLSFAGHQPMSDKTSNYWIIFNGEIYNYKKLKNIMIQNGEAFNSDTDTEVVLKYYIKYGEKCFEKFKGMWALIIYDKIKNELIICRDRFGIKPLYYYISSNGDIYFGSEIKQFVNTPSWEAKLNKNRAYDYLIHSQIDHTDETLFKGVFQCRQGHLIKINLDLKNNKINKKLEDQKWYNFEVPNKNNEYSFKNNSEHLRKLIDQSIDEHKISDVPVSYSLSGGLDSSILVLSEYYRNNLKLDTFSIFSKNKEVDESKWVKEVIRHKNINNKNIFLDTNEYSRSIKKILWSLDEPFNDNSIFSQWSLMELIKDNKYKVNIIGQGADEILSGYENYYYSNFFYLAKKLKLISLVKEVYYYKKHREVSYIKILKSLIGKFAPNIITILYHKRKSSKLSKKNKIINLKVEKDYIENKNLKTDKIDTLNKLNFYNLFYSSLPKLLRYADRTSMHNSLEVRVPYLDHVLVEYCLSLPPNFIINSGVSKFILRNAYKDLIPKKLFLRTDKIGFIPFNDKNLLKNENNYIYNELKDAIYNCKGLINKNILNFYDEINKDYNKFDPIIFRIIFFNNWIKLFKVKI